MGTSRGLSLEALAWWASVKGIQALACGDFTHPAWLAELKSSLRQTDDGLFDLQPPVELPAVKGHEGGARFVLGTEISCVYPQDGRSRRIHLLVLAPDFDAVDELCKAFSPYGALDSDGRPTLRLAGGDAVEAVLSVSSECEVIVAHAWTPWYSVYGSKSGFDSLDDCFGPMAEHVHAIETGLSSDPSMNWRVPELSERTLVSFSDAHSARKMGREVTAFAGEPTYAGIVCCWPPHWRHRMDRRVLPGGGEVPLRWASKVRSATASVRYAGAGRALSRLSAYIDAWRFASHGGVVISASGGSGTRWRRDAA